MDELLQLLQRLSRARNDENRKLQVAEDLARLRNNQDAPKDFRVRAQSGDNADTVDV